jgi:hypothetical protein
MLPYLAIHGALQIARLTQLGRLILVLWQDMGPEHPLIGRRYEQRIIYSHAALALAGMRAVMIPMALDEYAVSAAGPLQQLTLGAMVRNCAGGEQRCHCCCGLGPCSHDSWPDTSAMRTLFADG